MRSDLRIAVIGAGPGGICAGAKLLEAGFRDFVVLEQAAGAGGTWRHNTYPGSACDVQAHLYSFSFAPKVDWRTPYASQPEILAYLQSCADRFGVSPHMRFGAEVRSATWDERRNRWSLATSSGDTITADVVISAVGMFNEPAWPKIPGRELFSGVQFHSARWRHDWSLAGRRVAVIGSAASAVQIVPSIAPEVSQLYLYQRTPNWVLPKDNTPFDEDALGRFRRDPIALRQTRLQLWRNFIKLASYDPEMCRLAEQDGHKALAQITDPVLRAKLTPAYPFGAKRPLRSNDFYPALNRKNVEVVTGPIARIVPTGIVTEDGETRDVDTIIMATGFETAKFASSIDIHGAQGWSLRDAWSGGAEAYLGIATAGFPNLYMLYGPNTNNGSILYMIECQVEFILRQLRRMRDEGLAALTVRREVQDLYNVQLQADLQRIEVWNVDVNTYFRAESGRIVTQCPYLMSDYRELTSAPDPEAFDAVPAG